MRTVGNNIETDQLSMNENELDKNKFWEQLLVANNACLE